MSEKIFKERFCEITKIKVCTTTAELNFDTYTEPGAYEIYEDMGNGRNRIYLLAVDKSATGACVKQTRIYCGTVEARQSTDSGAWTAWQKVTGGSGGTIDINIKNGDGEVSIEQVAWEDKAKNSATGKGAVALGGYNRANGKCSMAANYNNEVKGENSFAANSSNKIGEGHIGCFVAGHCNETADGYQAIFGTYADVKENDAFVIGNGGGGKKGNAFKVDKKGNTTIAGETTTSGNVFVGKVLVAEKGLNVNANGIHVNGGGRIANSVFGDEGAEGYGTRSTVEGLGSVAFNRNNYVGGKHCFAALSSNTIPKGFESVFIAGHANIAAASHQAIFGAYSAPTANDAFIVGCGSSGNNKNGFVVDRVGNIRIGGNTIAIGSTTITEAQLKKLLAMIDEA